MKASKSTIKQLRSQIAEINTQLDDLQTENKLRTARRELAEIRSRGIASVSGPSMQDLEHRKERLETQLERAEEARNIKRFFLGSTVWGILGIYALVWLSNISHPEWALATTIIIGSIAGFLSFAISLMVYGSGEVS